MELFWRTHLSHIEPRKAREMAVVSGSPEYGQDQLQHFGSYPEILIAKRISGQKKVVRNHAISNSNLVEHIWGPGYLSRAGHTGVRLRTVIFRLQNVQTALGPT